MKSLLLPFLLLAAAAASAQENPQDAHEFLIAKLAAAEGEFDTALAHIDKAIERNPGNAVLLYERALMLLDAGRLDRAGAELRKIVSAHPDFYDAQRVIGRLLLDRAGNDRAKLDAALQHLEAAFRLNPDDLSTGTAVSQLLVAAARVADAEKVVAQLLERAPDHRALNYNYAQILTKLGRASDAKPYLEKVLQLDPTFGPAILQLVELYQKENEFAKAAEILQPLVGEDPANLDVRRQQALYWLRAGQSEKARASFRALTEAEPKDTRSLFYLAEALTDLEQYDEADRIYRSLLAKDPNDVDVLTSFGLAQLGRRNYDEAAKTFRMILGMKDIPENVQVLARTQLAFIALQNRDYGAALESANAVLTYGERPNTQAINIAVESLKKQKKYAEALALLHPLAGRFPTEPLVSARYVEMLVRVGEKEKARSVAAAQAKLGARQIIAVAEAYVQAADHATAISLLREALASRADDTDLLFALGSAYERAGDHAAAEKQFVHILEARPDHSATLNYLGYMWADRGVNLERAAEMLRKAVNQEPRNGAYVDSLGWVYFRQGKLDLAEKYLTDAARLLPRDATVHEHLGDVFAKRGDYVRALSLYRAALTLEPEPKEEEKLRGKIAQLEKQTQAAQSHRQ